MALSFAKRELDLPSSGARERDVLHGSSFLQKLSKYIIKSDTNKNPNVAIKQHNQHELWMNQTV